MLDFTQVWKHEKPLSELTNDLVHEDLAGLTNEITDTILDIISDCNDADVTFVPADPSANDPAASSADDANIAWTLGHVIVHLTAGNEETAALAAEMARGVEFHGRSRSEVPWETMTTIAQCRDRLEESRRMCVASLGMWPDAPDLEMTVEAFPNGPVVDAKGRYVIGIMHADSHVGQVRETVRQAQVARS